jgi:predicted Zn-dependent protease
MYKEDRVMHIFRYLKRSGACFIIVLLTILICCAVNPVTGKRELMLLTIGDEIKLGEDTDKEIVRTYGLYENPELTAYISEIGERMGKLTHRPELKYHYKVLDTPVINAFAVPGGYIYFTRGILGYFNNEAELAGVMGHELGHVNARHSAKQYSRAALAGLGIGLGSILSEDFRKVAGVVQFGVGMMFLKFSRDDERQADDLGVEYSSKTGYDARQMAHFFETLERLNPGSDMKGLPGWFSTHPNPTDRVAAVGRKTTEWQQKLGKSQYAVNRNNYLGNLDGIVFGEDPRQGYVEGNVFYHPVLRFMYPIPKDWTLINTPAQVQMVSKKEDAVIILSMDDAPSPAEAAKKFVESSQVSVQSSDAIRVNGLSTQKVISDFLSGDENIRVQSYFIKKDNSIYAFHGFTAKNDFYKYTPTFTGTMGGFKILTNPSKINVKPDRLALRTVRRRGTLKNILKQYGVADDKLEAMAILNGMQLNDMIETNTQIKLIKK